MKSSGNLVESCTGTSMKCTQSTVNDTTNSK